MQFLTYLIKPRKGFGVLENIYTANKVCAMIQKPKTKF
jgi:hypothetical protein